MRKRMMCLLLTACLLCAGAMGEGKNTKENEGEGMNFVDKVKVLGRRYFDGETLWLSTSAAQVEFVVEGASFLRLRLAGDGAAASQEGAHLKARYQIDVDGEKTGDWMMNEKARAHEIPVGDGQAHSVRLVKLSEAAHSMLGLQGIETDGEIRPAAEKARKIEFIGDSITCGYGIEGTLEMTFSTATENALTAYAARTAEAVDADYCLTAFSGFGIISGYTGDGAINERCLVPRCYENVSRCDQPLPDGRYLQALPWDFDAFRPDYIVLNLGTNDMSYCRDDAEKHAAFRRMYAEFLKTVRARNPEACILCVLGVMGGTLCPDMEGAVEDFRRQTGDENIRTLCVKDQDPALGYGTDWHPSAATHARLAAEVTAALQDWMK